MAHEPVATARLPQHVRAFALNGAVCGLRPTVRDHGTAGCPLTTRARNAALHLMRALETRAKE